MLEKSRVEQHATTITEIMAGIPRPMSLYRINGTLSRINMKQIVLFLAALALTAALTTARADDTNAPAADHGIKKAAPSLADKSQAAAQNISEKTKDLAKKSLEKAGEIAAKVGDATKNGLDRAGDAAQRAGDKIKEDAQRAGDAIQRAANKVQEKFGTNH